MAIRNMNTNGGNDLWASNNNNNNNNNNDMNQYNNENGRKNMRLHGYDYSRTRLYFLTPVLQNRLQLFGKIVRTGIRTGDPLWSSNNNHPIMILNDAGRMVEKWYWEIENKYPDKRCHEMVVMPNHFHCIIENLDMPNGNERNMDEQDAHIGALRGRPENDTHPENDMRSDTNEKYGIHNKIIGATIGDVMDWFKTMTTNEYIRGVKQYDWTRFDGKLWQRNYYDHIIRNEPEYLRISEYIINNPLKWNDDKFYND